MYAKRFLRFLICLIVQSLVDSWFYHNTIYFIKDVKELSWMSHRVIRFWFVLNFLFISVFFDILASLLISRNFPEFNAWGTFLSNYKHFSCQSSCLLLLLKYCKNHYRKEKISVDGSKQGRDTLSWIHLKETWLNLFI